LTKIAVHNYVSNASCLQCIDPVVRHQKLHLAQQYLRPGLVSVFVDGGKRVGYRYSL